MPVIPDSEQEDNDDIIGEASSKKEEITSSKATNYLSDFSALEDELPSVTTPPPPPSGWYWGAAAAPAAAWVPRTVLLLSHIQGCDILHHYCYAVISISLTTIYIRFCFVIYACLYRALVYIFIFCMFINISWTVVELTVKSWELSLTKSVFVGYMFIYISMVARISIFICVCSHVHLNTLMSILIEKCRSFYCHFVATNSLEPPVSNACLTLGEFIYYSTVSHVSGLCHTYQLTQFSFTSYRFTSRWYILFISHVNPSSEFLLVFLLSLIINRLLLRSAIK